MDNYILSADGTLYTYYPKYHLVLKCQPLQILDGIFTRDVNISPNTTHIFVIYEYIIKITTKWSFDDTLDYNINMDNLVKIADYLTHAEIMTYSC